MVSTQPKLVTVDDLLELPSDLRCELIEGHLVEMSPTQNAHIVVTSRLSRQLGRYFDDNPEMGDVWIGEGGYIVGRDPDTVAAPDLAIVSVDQAKQGSADGRGFMPFAPIIPVEIKSPNDTEAEIARKLSLYLEAGALEVWWVRPAHKTITIHRPDGSIDLLRVGDTLTSDILPGFRLELGDLFA